MRPFYIRGIINKVDKNMLIIESFSIGYLVEVVEGAIFEVNKETTLYLYEFQYEDRYSLYGFSSEDDLTLFTELLSVKGVGPKTALCLFRKISPAKLRMYIVEGSKDSIASIGDLGPLTSSEIVSSLRARIKKQGIKPRRIEILNVIKAARCLGFKSKDIEPIVDKYCEVEMSEGELLKEVLKNLRRTDV